VLALERYRVPHLYLAVPVLYVTADYFWYAATCKKWHAAGVSFVLRCASGLHSKGEPSLGLAIPVPHMAALSNVGHAVLPARTSSTLWPPLEPTGKGAPPSSAARGKAPLGLLAQSLGRGSAPLTVCAAEGESGPRQWSRQYPVRTDSGRRRGVAVGGGDLGRVEEEGRGRGARGQRPGRGRQG